MRLLDWSKKNEIVCKAEKMWGVDIAFTFNLDPKNGQWFRFVKSLEAVYPEGASDLISAVVNDNLLLFDTEEEARKVYGVMLQPELKNVYACLISPVGTVTENT